MLIPNASCASSLYSETTKQFGVRDVVSHIGDRCLGRRLRAGSRAENVIEGVVFPAFEMAHARPAPSVWNSENAACWTVKVTSRL